MKPRRRTIIKIIALLAAGATLNVAVAWGLAAWYTREHDVSIYLINKFAKAVGEGAYRRCGFRFAVTDGTRRSIESGWPIRSMERDWSGDTHLPPLHTALIAENLRAIPHLPLWPGFAINALFYAGVLWMLFCGPFALRRMIRRRRGLCPACAYPIGTNTVCTECGAAVPQKA